MFQNGSRYAACALLAAMASIASAIPTPDTDPDFVEAARYDSELNGGNRDVADRTLAEAAYLRYLPKVTDPVQRSQVLVQLGVLYATNYNPRKGEQADPVKARSYFTQAIELVPDRVNGSLLRARTLIVSSRQTDEERLETRITAYKWLLETAESDLEKRLLPRVAGKPVIPGARPPQGPVALPLKPGEAEGERAATASELRVFRSALDSIIKTETVNIVNGAVRSKDPLKLLRRIIEALPGTPAAERARTALSDYAKRVESNVAQESIAAIGAEWTSPPTEPVADSAALAASSVSSAPAAQPIASGASRHSMTAWLVAAGTIAVALLVWRAWRIVKQ